MKLIIVVLFILIPMLVILLPLGGFSGRRRPDAQQPAFVWTGVGLGALAIPFAIVIELFLIRTMGATFQGLSSPTIHAYGIAATTEELLKLLATLAALGLFRDRAGQYPGLPIAIALSIALGFAMIENIFYGLGSPHSVNSRQFVGMMVLRTFSTLPMHLTCGLFMGVLLVRRQTSSTASARSLWLAAALMVPLVLHGSYNFVQLQMLRALAFAGRRDWLQSPDYLIVLGLLTLILYGLMSFGLYRLRGWATLTGRDRRDPTTMPAP